MGYEEMKTEMVYKCSCYLEELLVFIKATSFTPL